MKKLLLTLLLFSAGTGISAAKTYDLKSPDGKIAVRVDVGADAVTYSISRDGKELIAPSPLSLTLADGRVLGRKASVRKASAKSVDEIIEAPFYKRSAVEDRYNSLTLTFKGDYGIDFRAYDDGAAYRFRTSMKDEITVTDELVDIRFPEDFTTLVPYARDGKKEPGLARYYFNSFENTYSTQPVSKVADDRLAFLPILADAGTAKIVITEADLEDYPGMYLYNPTGGKALRGNFAPYPAKEVQGGHNELQLLVTERGLHRPHLGDPHLPVARLRHRRTRHPAGRQRHGLPSRRTLARGGRLVDQTRQGGLGLVEHLEPLRRGLQVGNQQRNL